MLSRTYKTVVVMGDDMCDMCDKRPARHCGHKNDIT